MRIVCGLDVHKNSVFVYILNDKGEKFEAKYGVLTPGLEELRQLPLNHEVKEVTMESTSNYVSSIDSKSYKEVVRLLSEGTVDPKELSKVIHGRTKKRAGEDVKCRPLRVS